LPPCCEQSGLQTALRLRGKLVGMLSIEDLGQASLLRQPARGYGRWSSEAEALRDQVRYRKDRLDTRREVLKEH
jgi:hypothetical protein